MTIELRFKRYESADGTLGLGLFDENCPEFFAPNEREDYIEFLNSRTQSYFVCLLGDRIVGAYGRLGAGYASGGNATRFVVAITA
jgi:hypothetical protein